jgi:hypothetical protein
MPAQAWISKYGALLDGAVVPCPECGAGPIAVRFVGDPATRLGFAVLFCVACRSKVHLSRLTVPTDRDLAPFEATEALSDLDEYRLID